MERLVAMSTSLKIDKSSGDLRYFKLSIASDLNSLLSLEVA